MTDDLRRSSSTLRAMGPARSVQSPLLVGRDEALQLADRQLVEVAAGRGLGVLLAGEAGIGKSRLMWAILRKAEALGFHVGIGALEPVRPRGDAGLGPRPGPRHALVGSLPGAGRGPARPRARPRGRYPRPPPHARPRDRGPDPRGGRRSDAARLRRPAMGGRAQPGGRRGAGATRRRPAAPRPRRLPAGRAPVRVDPSRVAGPAAQPAARRGGPPVAAHLRRDGARDDAHPRDRACRRRARWSARCSRGRTASRSTSRSCSRRWATRNGPTGGRIREAHVPETIEDAVLARYARLSPRRPGRRARLRRHRPLLHPGGRRRAPRPAGRRPRRAAPGARGQAFLYPFNFLDRGFYDFRHQLLRDALYGTVQAGELRRLHARAAEFGGLIEGASEIHASVHFERAGMRREAYRAALSRRPGGGRVSSRREAFELYARAVANAPDDLPPGELAALLREYCAAAFAVDDVPVAEDSARLAPPLLTSPRAGCVEAAFDLVSLAGARAARRAAGGGTAAAAREADAELVPLPETPDRNLVLSEVRDAAGPASSWTRSGSTRRRRCSTRRVGSARIEGSRHGRHRLPRRRAGRARGTTSTRASTRCSRSRVAARTARLESTGVTAFRWLAGDRRPGHGLSGGDRRAGRGPPLRGRDRAVVLPPRPRRDVRRTSRGRPGAGTTRSTSPARSSSSAAAAAGRWARATPSGSSRSAGARSSGRGRCSRTRWRSAARAARSSWSCRRPGASRRRRSWRASRTGPWSGARPAWTSRSPPASARCWCRSS